MMPSCRLLEFRDERFEIVERNLLLLG